MTPKEGRQWPVRVAFVLIVILLLFTAVLAPLVVGNVVLTVLGSPQDQLYVISTTPHREAAPTHTDMFIQIVALEEARGRVTLQLAGYHICETACNWSDRISLYSLWDVAQLEGLPPSASITLTPSRNAAIQEVQLPVRGQPVRYPFDSYQIRLGIGLERVFPDGTSQTVPPDEARRQLFLAIQPRLAQQTIDAPVPLDTQQIGASGAPGEYVYATTLTIHRQFYLRVLTIVLVVLIAAASVYAVFLRAFQELIINVGGLILGIWGIRGILTPASVNYITAIDLSLSVVILFLLGAVTVRALLYVGARGGRSAIWRLRK